MNQTVLFGASARLAQDIRSENSLDRGLSSGQRTPFHHRWFGFGTFVPLWPIRRAAVALGIAAVLCGPALAFPFLNKDGQRVEVASQLPPEKETVVFFHAPWSKTSSRYQVELTNWEKSQAKVAVLGVQVKALDSPVAKQYSVTSVPWFLIYNKKGELTHSGQAALSEVLKMMKEPAKP